MFKILGSTGKLYEIGAVVPIVEGKIRFNGTMEYRLEVARSMEEKPNGLLFLKDVRNIEKSKYNSMHWTEYIGNLSTKEVKNVMNTLLKEGYFDLSEWKYQREASIEKLILDNGKSAPYSSAITAEIELLSIRKPRSNYELDCDEWRCADDLEEEDFE